MQPLQARRVPAASHGAITTLAPGHPGTAGGRLPYSDLVVPHFFDLGSLGIDVSEKNRRTIFLLLDLESGPAFARFNADSWAYLRATLNARDVMSHAECTGCRTGRFSAPSRDIADAVLPRCQARSRSRHY
jgi:hypothetical protein